MDIKTFEERSKNMAAIRCRDTKPELILRKALFNKGLRYRIISKLPGKPDLVFPSRKLAIFVDGCFWHCCPKCFKAPSTNSEFWREKIAANMRRDEEVNNLLADEGWKVERYWEHEIYQDLDEIVQKIFNIVKK